MLNSFTGVPKEKSTGCGGIFGDCCTDPKMAPRDIPPVTKYGLTYFPYTYRFEFTDLDREEIKPNTCFKFDFWAILENPEAPDQPPEIWKIASGKTVPEDQTTGGDEDEENEQKEDENEPQTKKEKKDELNQTLKQWIDAKLNKDSVVHAPGLLNREKEKFPSKDWSISMASYIKDEKIDPDTQDRKLDLPTRRNVFINGVLGLRKILNLSSEDEEMATSGAWAKITTFVLTSDAAETLKWDSEKNEYPVMPSHGIEDVVISDTQNTVELMLKFWTSRDKNIKSDVESFVLKQCRPLQFHATLKKCIRESDDPIHTAMKASAICEERKTLKNSTGVEWDDEKNKAIAIAIRLAEFIPNQMKKLHMTTYYSEAAKVMLDENLDRAIENQFQEICADPVFVERLENRWKLKGTKRSGLRILERTPPRICFILQAISFLVFIILMSYSTTTASGVYILSYRSALEDRYFDDRFGSIRDPASFWEWMELSVLPATFPENITDRYVNHQWLATPDVLLRQYRVLPLPDGDCFLHKYNLSCYPSVDLAVSTKPSLLVGFGDLEYYRDIPYANTTWVDDAHKSTYLTGLNFKYESGGYMAKFSAEGDLNEALTTLSDLRDTRQWIDEATRAVVVEFSLYELD